MSQPLVGVYTIGQTPRPDLTEELGSRLATARFEIRGALDAVASADLAPRDRAGYPLETRLRDGTRIVVDASFLEPHLQAAISELDDRVVAHLVLCAGPFPGLVAARPLIRPFEVAVKELADLGLHSLEVVLPFAEQAPPAARKWEAAGFTCRPHVVADLPEGEALAGWLRDRVSGSDAGAVVFDYVGFPPATMAEVRAEIGLPVFDLGDLALDALERTLNSHDAGH